MENNNVVNPQVSLNYNQSLNKGQYSVMSKACLIAGLAFALICGIGFLFSYMVENVFTSPDQLYTANTIAIIALIASFGVSIFASFRKNLSWGTIVLMYGLFIISFGITFGMFFAIYDVKTLLLAFVTAAGALIITGIIGFAISNKVAMSISKMTMVLFVAYLVFMVVSLVMMYTIFQPSQWWMYLVDIVIGLLIFGSNVMTFYSLKKSSEFAAAVEISDKQKNVLIWMLAFNVLVSVVNTLLLFLRIFGQYSN